MYFLAMRISRCLNKGSHCSWRHKELLLSAAALTTVVSAPLMAPINHEDHTG